MAANYATTFFFETLQNSQGYGSSAWLGWAEKWYIDFTGSIDDLLVSEPVNTYIRLRRACLASQCRMSWVRASSIAKLRVSKLRDLGAAVGTAPGASPTLDQAPVTSVMRIRMTRLPRPGGPEAEQAHHRNFDLRGLVKQDIHGDTIAATSPNGDAIHRFLRYVARGTVGNFSTPTGVASSQWQLRYNDLSQPSGFIGSLAVGIGGRTLTMFQPGGLVVGDRVQLYGIRDVPAGANRTWTVIALPADPPGTVVLGTARRPLGGIWDGTGRWRKVNSFLYGSPDEFVYIGLRSRKCGPPYRPTRGRRSARR